MAEIPTFQTFGGSADAASARTYILRQGPDLARRLRLTVNESVVPLVPDLSGARVSLRPGQGGLPVTRIELTLSGRLPAAGRYQLDYRDDSFGGRAGWKEIVVRAGPGVVLSGSTVPTHDVSHMLRSYPSGLLATPLDIRRASVSFRYGEGGVDRCRLPRPHHRRGGRRHLGPGLHLAGRAAAADAGFRPAGDRDRDVLGLPSRAQPGAREDDRGGLPAGVARHRAARRVPGRHRHRHAHRRRARPRRRHPLPVPVHRPRDALSMALAGVGRDGALTGGGDADQAAGRGGREPRPPPSSP